MRKRSLSSFFLFFFSFPYLPVYLFTYLWGRLAQFAEKKFTQVDRIQE